MDQVLLRKLTVAQEVKKTVHFMQPFITVPQQSASGPYPEPEESNQHPHSPFL
jgi:hypothetical protein